MQKIYFTPGPTEVDYVARQAIREALENGVCSISHRSSEYENIQAFTEKQLRALLDVPADYRIYFLSSGTESWERIIQNGVKATSLHLVNGAFSRRFFETASELGKFPRCIERQAGEGFNTEDISAPVSEEMICLTHNETSTGVSLEPGFIEKLHSLYPESLIAVDAVSSAPYPLIDISATDYYFFSVQKFFSLPAGLGILIVSPRALDKSSALRNAGISTGSHHSLHSLESFSKKFQTPCTPNVLGIFSLGKMAEHLNNVGINTLRSETDYKAGLIYDVLDSHSNLRAFVSDNRFRSRTVITVDCGNRTDELAGVLAGKGLICGQGYGKFRDSQIRIANFAAHSAQSFKKLAEEIADFR